MGRDQMDPQLNDEFDSPYADLWEYYSLEAISLMVATEGTDPETYHQITAWGQTYELLWKHASVLKHCTEELAAKWPPDQSPAARAFIDYINMLVANMDSVGRAAIQNSLALMDIVETLNTAKAKVAGIVDQKKAIQGKKGAAAATARFDEAARTVMRDADQAV